MDLYAVSKFAAADDTEGLSELEKTLEEKKQGEVLFVVKGKLVYRMSICTPYFDLCDLVTRCETAYQKDK